MIEKAINKVLLLGQPNFKEHAGKLFSDKPLKEVKPEAGPVPGVLKIKTLSGIVDYIKNNLDDEAEYVIHIDDYDKVQLYGKYDGEFCRRKQYICADSELRGFNYGQWMDHESFIISILSFFKPNESRSSLMEYLASLSDNTSVNLMDDGVSQSAEVKTGVVSKSEKKVPNPVDLLPFETFPEIDVLKRDFVFRIKKRSAGVLECALFESGDTKWKIDYIQLIKKYFDEQLKDEAKHISIIA